MNQPGTKELDYLARIARREAGRLKILYVGPYFKPTRRYGDAVEPSYRLCLSLARIGREVRVLTTNADGLDRVLPVSTRREHATTAGFRVRYCQRLMRHSVSPGLLHYLFQYMKWADIVHLTAVYLFTTLSTMAACRVLRKQFVWSPRGALQSWCGSRRNAARYVWELGCRIDMPSSTVLHVTSEH